jgi:hypothetical protein
MIRLPILIVDVFIRPRWKWAHWVRLLTHRRLTGVSPWQPDDLDRLHGRICAWPEAEAQSGLVVGSRT